MRVTDRRSRNQVVFVSRGFMGHESRTTNHVSFGSGDCFKYAATPMMADIAALTMAMASVERSPACKLKCAGSMPTAAKPVMTPLAPPAMAAAAMPFSQVCQVDTVGISNFKSQI